MTASQLQVYYYFFGLNCDSCKEAISYLNELSPYIRVTGIITNGNIDKVKLKKYGVRFPVKTIKETGRRFKPGYVPSIIGVTKPGTVIFMQPGVPSYERSNPLIYDALHKINID